MSFLFDENQITGLFFTDGDKAVMSVYDSSMDVAFFYPHLYCLDAYFELKDSKYPELYITLLNVIKYENLMTKEPNIALREELNEKYRKAYKRYSKLLKETYSKIGDNNKNE